ncbi:MAG: carboxypeptidase [Acidobacteria bacterium]|nr:carboxypeptidase [Acidobacteriota bacterium]
MYRIVRLLAAAVVVTSPLAAQEAPAAAEPPVIPEAKSSVTHHEISVGGERIAYTATAGYLIVDSAEEKPVAKFGYTAYVRDGFDNPAERAITFAFNGGPGSASIWLHMGVLGPKIVVTPDADFAAPPPYQVIDNEHSIIDVTDLVMIDPVGTGYSRPIGEAKGEDFWGVDQDIDSVSRFIKEYVSQNERWASPKILLGESYGGMRSGGVALELLERHGMALNGTVLVSPFMEMVTGFDGLGIDLPHVMFLPTLSATAWYHEALADRPDDLRSLLAEVKAFAYDEYAPALLRGSRLGESERAAVLAKLARYTGVGADYWDRANLRVNHQQFVKELLRDRKQTVGRIDSRYAGRSFNLLGEEMSYDPQAAAVSAAFTSAFLHYYHHELDFGRDLEYKVSGGLWREWDWSHRAPDSGGFTLPFPNTSIDLAHAMGKNPAMKLLVQQGYYDLATPQLATEYYIDHMDLLPQQRENITFEYYDAGHMMYLHPPSLVKFKDDLARFIRMATGT